MRHSENLFRLNNVKLRFSEELTELCEQYLTESDKLDEENRDKDSLKARIKEVNECIDVTYVSGLNRYLERLHADFRISKVKTVEAGWHRMAGGLLHSAYGCRHSCGR